MIRLSICPIIHVAKISELKRVFRKKWGQCSLPSLDGPSMDYSGNGPPLLSSRHNGLFLQGVNIQLPRLHNLLHKESYESFVFHKNRQRIKTDLRPNPWSSMAISTLSSATAMSNSPTRGNTQSNRRGAATAQDHSGVIDQTSSFPYNIAASVVLVILYFLDRHGDLFQIVRNSTELNLYPSRFCQIPFNCSISRSTAIFVSFFAPKDPFGHRERHWYLEQ